MPIGWETAGGRVVSRRSTAARESSTNQSTWWTHLKATAVQTAQAITRDEPVHRALIPTRWTRWSTAYDERVCPICAPFAGRVWPDGEGPEPPLHPNCRCARVFAFTTWSTG